MGWKKRALQLGLLIAGGTIARRLIRAGRTIDLYGRTVLITGGSRGLGLRLAHELGQRGADIAFCGRDEEAVQRAAEQLRSRGIRVLAGICDISDRASAESFVDTVASAFGRIDVLVNNAGVIQVGPLDNATPDHFEQAMGTNFFGAIYMTLRALPHLRRQGNDGRIVNITSLGGRIGMPHMAPYTASKFALLGLSETLRAELDAQSPSPRVVTVIPGLMRTGSMYNAEFIGHQSEEFAWFSVSSSAPGISIDAEEAAMRIAQAICDGRAFLELSASQRILDTLHRISPRATVALMSLGARLLPSPGGAGSHRNKGRDVESRLPGTWALRLGDQAAVTNNEA